MHLKQLVIDLTEKLLDLEKITLSSFVDFSRVLEQKFDKVGVEENQLILKKEKEKLELPIKGDSSLISKVINQRFGQENLGLVGKIISLNELMSLPVVDFEKQNKIKDEIDNLVYCLYFNIDISKDNVQDTKFVKSFCEKNRFYKLLNKI
jgi:hypothetical protein